MAIDLERIKRFLNDAEQAARVIKQTNIGQTKEHAINILADIILIREELNIPIPTGQK